MATPKIIPYQVKLRSTTIERSLVRPIVYTNDLRSAEFQFQVTDMQAGELSGATATTLLYMRDGSFFQNPKEDVELTGTTFSYLLKEDEGNHAGIARIQLVVRFNEGLDDEQNFPSQLYDFEIVNGLETQVAQQIMIHDWTTLTREARAYIDEFAANEILREAEFDNNEFDRNAAFNLAQTNRQNQFSDLAEDLTATLAAADANIEEFDVALETGIAAAKLAEKLEDFEEINNSRLLSTERQLAEAEPQLKSTPYLYQNMGIAFDSNDPTLVDHDTHASWAYSNVHWDAKINKVVVFYTIKPIHALSNVRLMMRHMDVNYNFTAPSVVADGRASNLALRSQGSIILPNGDYLVLVSRMNNTTSEQLGCDVYKSTDSGATWTITEILVGGQPIKRTDGDINGCIVLESGRVITYLKEYQTNLARFLYSDDNGATWAFANWISGGWSPTNLYYNYSEPAFLQLSNGTIICYLRPNSGGQPGDVTPEIAVFTKSTDNGLTWTPPEDSSTITDFTQGNGKLLLDKEAGRVEFLYYSRHKKLDDMSSIYQSIASEADAENDNFSAPNRIMRFNRTDSYDGKIGDGGYVGACFLPDKTVVGFFYTGDKVNANICYFIGKKGTKHNANGAIEERYGLKAVYANDYDVNAPNLFPLQSAYWQNGTMGGNLGAIQTISAASNRLTLVRGIDISKNATYELSNYSVTYDVSILEYDANFLLLTNTGWLSYNYKLRSNPSVKYIRFVIRRKDDADLTPADVVNVAYNFKKIATNIDNMSGGVSVPTKIAVDNKAVMVKRLSIGALPNAAEKEVVHGLDMSKIVIDKIIGSAQSDAGYMIPLPFVANDVITKNVLLSMRPTTLVVHSGNQDRSIFVGNVEIYYHLK